MSAMARRSRSRPAGFPSRSFITTGAPAAPIMSCPGNKEYLRGDEIPRPNGGEGQGGREGSPDGSGEDAFEFTLSKDEFLDMFFEDLELPDLVKKSLKDTTAVDLQRAGYTVTGTPSNLSVPRTMRNSMGGALRSGARNCPSSRRCAPRSKRRAPAATMRRSTGSAKDLERIERRSKIIPYIDPIDVRYRRFDRVPKPNTEAVMFCLMDVSGSMTEAMKDLAKRFFMLLHVFLVRRYRHVDIVFIRHTSTAEEVDEETFFYSRETGGTVVSTALEKMLEIARARYPTDRWNIYGAQASDGDNYGADSGRCVRCSATMSCRCASTSPISRSETASGQLDRAVARQRFMARLQRSGAGASAFRDAAGRRSGSNIPGIPRVVREGGRACLAAWTTRRSRRRTALHRSELGFRLVAAGPRGNRAHRGR